MMNCRFRLGMMRDLFEVLDAERMCRAEGARYTESSEAKAMDLGKVRQRVEWSLQETGRCLKKKVIPYLTFATAFRTPKPMPQRLVKTGTRTLFTNVPQLTKSHANGKTIKPTFVALFATSVATRKRLTSNTPRGLEI